MSDRRVLVAEDDDAFREVLTGYLSGRDFDVEFAENGADALKKFEAGGYNVVLTDLEMPVMGGAELIENLKKNEYPPTVIVMTANNEPEMIIRIMNMGVFQYLIKPAGVNEILFNVTKALEHEAVDRANRIYQKEKTIHLERQLEWYQWHERMKAGGGDAEKSNLFDGLVTGFNQGGGFGSLVVLIEMIQSAAEKTEDGFYKINAELFDYVVQNSRLASNALNTFSHINGILINGLHLSPAPVSEVYGLMKKVVEESKPFAELSHHRVLVSDAKPVFSEVVIDVNKESFEKVIVEGLKNAYKFSSAGSSIVIMTEVINSMFRVSIMNTPYPDDKGRRGVPIEFENIIFEPFFRLNRTVLEKYKTLDFGLGLTMCEKVLKAHGGSVRLYNITDYSSVQSRADEDSSRKVFTGELRTNLELNFPIKDDSSK